MLKFFKVRTRRPASRRSRQFIPTVGKLPYRLNPGVCPAPINYPPEMLEPTTPTD